MKKCRRYRRHWKETYSYKYERKTEKYLMKKLDFLFPMWYNNVTLTDYNFGW